MITYLKRGRSDADVAAADAKVRATVEGILADIEKRGDAAVRELAKKFDGHAPENFRLSDDQIAAAIAKVSPDDIADIEFAQAQVRNFAEKQKECLRDLAYSPKRPPERFEFRALPGRHSWHDHPPPSQNLPWREDRTQRARNKRAPAPTTSTPCTVPSPSSR